MKGRDWNFGRLWESSTFNAVAWLKCLYRGHEIGRGNKMYSFQADLRRRKKSIYKHPGERLSALGVVYWAGRKGLGGNAWVGLLLCYKHDILLSRSQRKTCTPTQLLLPPHLTLVCLCHLVMKAIFRQNSRSFSL